MKNLTNLWLDKENQLNVVLEGGEKFKLSLPIEPYFYIDQKKEKVASFWLRKYGIDGTVQETNLKTIKGEPVSKVTVEEPNQRYVLAQVLPTYEFDVPYLFQVREVLGWRTGLDYRTIYFDIEWDSEHNIVAIGVCDNSNELVLSGDEQTILDDFLKILNSSDLAVSYGGNEFDVPILEKALRRYGLSLPYTHFLDFEILLQSYGQRQLPSYKLEWVSEFYLGRKRKYSGSIKGLSQEQIEERVLDDTQILVELEKKLRLVEVAIRKAYLSNLFPEDTYFVSHCIEALLLVKAHQLGYVLNNRGEGRVEGKHSGAYVMKPPEANKIFENVAYFDLKSLYPSIIVNFGVSPDPEKKLYPELLKELIHLREIYKDDYAMEQALKLIANGMYGYLTSPNSRVFSMELGDFVATKGREILTHLINEVSEKYPVLAGDTDSVFVQLPLEQVEQVKNSLEESIKNKFGVEFRIDLKDYFKKLFFFRKGRGKADVAKKRYAGINMQDKLVLTGVEAIRSDIPEVVSRFQETLIRMFLDGYSRESIQDFIKSYRDSLFLFPVEDFVIYRNLGKGEGKYKVTPAHLRAYKEAKARGIEITEDKIPYLWVSGKPVFYEEGKSYQVDVKYYWEHYFEGVIERTLGGHKK